MNRADITVGSFFDGIGGTLLCATICGATPVWASEIEKFPIAVTKHHFPGVVHLGDITKISGEEIPSVDVAVGGSPCQDLSVAGKRQGMKHSELGDEDGTRSGLFMEQIRTIKEQRRKYGKPRFMVWENVPGALSSNNGEDFRIVLEETARVADSAVSIPRSVSGWANAGSVLADGFSISWRIIDAQYFGVPQRRRRVYLVADFGGQSAPEILFERESLPGYSAEGYRARQGTAASAGAGVENAIPVLDMANPSNECNINIVPTLCSRMGTGGNQVPITCYGISAYESNAMKSDNPHSGIYEADTARTIDQNGGNPACNQGVMMVVEPTVYDMTHANEAIRECGDKSPTLQNRMGTGGNQVPVVMAHGQANAEIAVDQCPTLNCNHEQPIIATQTVRRLTPLECERLQGYPDNYTNIPGASDTARYKALGNSFEIDCALFVISGCIEVLAKT